MAEIKNSSTYTTSSFLSTHTLSNFSCSGTNMGLIVFSFHRNPETNVAWIRADGNDMALELSSINADVCSVQGYKYLINNADFDIVTSTPNFDQQTKVALAIENTDQTTFVKDSDQAGAFGDNATISYTGTAGNLLLVAVTTQNSRTLTASGVTEQHNFLADGDIGQCFVGYATATGSSQSVGATLNSSDNFCVMVLELEPASEAVGDVVKVKVSGSFITAQKKVKVSGTFQDVTTNVI